MVCENLLLKVITNMRRCQSTPISIRERSCQSVVIKNERNEVARYYLKAEPSVFVTNREYAVCKLIQSGFNTYKDLGSKLELSPRTVEAHLTSIRKKLGVGYKKELVRRLSSAEFVPVEVRINNEE